MRKLMNITSPNVPSIRTITAGPPKMAWPNGVSPTMLPAALVTTAAWKVSQEMTPVRATPMAM